MPGLIPMADSEVAKTFQKILTKQGLKMNLGQKVVGVDKGANSVKVTFEANADGAKTEMEVDRVLVSVGRRPATKSLGLESIGIELDRLGRIPVDMVTLEAKGT